MTQAVLDSPRRVDDSSGPAFRRIMHAREFGVVAATLAVCVCAAIFTDYFFTAQNLLSVAQQIALLGIVAAGMTLLIIAGEMDLSVGSSYGFLAVAMAWMVTEVGIPVGTTIPLTIGLGAAIGLLNGWITTRFNIPSFVVTLAALSILRGAALLLADGVPVRGSRSEPFREAVSGTPVPYVSMQTVWMVLVILILGLVLANTKLGSDIYATGGNRLAANQAGIRTVRVKLICFAITGALTGLAAVILVGWLGSANPLTGTGFELSVIAAVVVGGAGLAGGTGTMLGTFLGAVITGVIANMLVLLGVDGNWQQVGTGLLILAAVLLNNLVGRRQARAPH